MAKRFVEIRDGSHFLILDCKNPNMPVVVCKCEGYNAPLSAEYVVAALEAYHRRLIELVVPEEAIP